MLYLLDFAKKAFYIYTGPWLVPDKNLTQNSQDMITEKNEVKSQIQLYMGLDAGVCIALMIAGM